MKIFCKDLKDQPKKRINCEKKEMITLTDEEKESYENQKICHIREKEFSTDNKDKKHRKVRDYCHYTGNYREQLIIIVIYVIKYLKRFI